MPWLQNFKILLSNLDKTIILIFKRGDLYIIKGELQQFIVIVLSLKIPELDPTLLCLYKKIK